MRFVPIDWATTKNFISPDLQGMLPLKMDTNVTDFVCKSRISLTLFCLKKDLMRILYLCGAFHVLRISENIWIFIEELLYLNGWPKWSPWLSLGKFMIFFSNIFHQNFCWNSPLVFLLEAFVFIDVKTFSELFIKNEVFCGFSTLSRLCFHLARIDMALCLIFS